MSEDLLAELSTMAFVRLDSTISTVSAFLRLPETWQI
jgi:hypothetical protein